MTISQLRSYLNEQAQIQNIELVPHSSTVSWLYPGQFAYCLNEEFIWDKFGSMIDCPEMHFHKIQPVIRWDDFIEYFKNEKDENFHLTSFEMSTINGGHIVPIEYEEEFSLRSFSGIIEFLTKIIGLDKSKLEISYFNGASLNEIGTNRQGKSKFDFDYYFPEDNKAKVILQNLGIQENQLIPDNSRNCFLIPNWICGEIAPWGYRNEINYQTEKGLVDIATVERLTWRPVYQDGKIIKVENWGKAFVINGSGLERLTMLKNNLASIFEIDSIKPLFYFIENKNFNNHKLLVESARIVHRIIADTKGNLIDTRSPNNARDRRRKFNFILKVLSDLQKPDLVELFSLNAKLNSDYPELSEVVNLCVEQVIDYKKRLDLSS